MRKLLHGAVALLLVGNAGCAAIDKFFGGQPGDPIGPVQYVDLSGTDNTQPLCTAKRLDGGSDAGGDR